MFDMLQKKDFICRNCKTIMKPKKLYKGAFWIEALIWAASIYFIFTTFGISIFIALAYSTWRITDKPKVCKECNSSSIIPLDSPAAKEMIKDFNRK